MLKTVAIFGAGPALGLSVARRFGREGYRVALVARRQESLDELAAALPDVETATFRADLLDPAQLTAAVTEVKERFGQVDVGVWSPGGLDMPRVDVLDIDPDELPGQLGLLLLAPIRLASLLLPEMRKRGDGALLFASGTSAIAPVPQLGNVGIALAALRNYVFGANAALAGEGVYVGIVPIGGLIRNSAAEAAVLNNPAAFENFDLEALKLTTIDPDAIAEVFWDLNLKRDRVEEIVGNGI
ncbi:SDR family NAD(P)-dependent oxidoreductase [Actinophytocola sp.]|uniref:SDR family NAD(P)-dependent oxidoreductase n=1 Tax=Actinophytocola sp. TaxID=1872138 RepID=UPI002ED40D73